MCYRTSSTRSSPRRPPASTPAGACRWAGLVEDGHDGHPVRELAPRHGNHVHHPCADRRLAALQHADGVTTAIGRRDGDYLHRVVVVVTSREANQGIGTQGAETTGAPNGNSLCAAVTGFTY
jgi:hypothetical protein